MRNVKDLVNSIVTGTIKTKVIAGAIAGTVVVGGGVGTYVGIQHHNEKVAIAQEIENKKETVTLNLQVIEKYIGQLPEDKTVELREGLEELKAIDLKNDYEKAYELSEELSEKLSVIVTDYKADASKKLNEMKGMSTSDFSEEERKRWNEVYGNLSNAVSQDLFKEIDAKYEECKKVHAEIVEAVNNRKAEEEAAKKAEEEAKQAEENGNSEESSSDSSWSDSTGGSSDSSWSGSSDSSWSGSSSTGSTSGGSSSSTGSSSSGSSNGGSSNSGSAQSTPSAPSVAVGYKSEAVAAIIGSHVNTNNYDLSSNYCVMTSEQYNYLYSISQQYINGSIGASSVDSQMKGKSFDFLGIGNQSATYVVATTVTIPGYNVNTIAEDLFSIIGYGGVSFRNCSVYFDGTNTIVTYVGADVDIIY